jgi:transcriptional antiterminator RfaH
LVRFAGEPKPMPAGLVESLMEQCGAESEVDWAFEPGKEVEVVSGPFQGVKAIFLARDGEERVKILLDLLGKPCTLTISEAACLPC